MTFFVSSRLVGDWISWFDRMGPKRFTAVAVASGVTEKARLSGSGECCFAETCFHSEEMSVLCFGGLCHCHRTCHLTPSAVKRVRRQARGRHSVKLGHRDCASLDFLPPAKMEGSILDVLRVLRRSSSPIFCADFREQFGLCSQTGCVRKQGAAFVETVFSPCHVLT